MERDLQRHRLVILGSTGSIGTQALEVAEQAGWRIVGLAAQRNIDLLEEQVHRFCPEAVTVYDVAAAKELEERLAGTDVKVLSGMDGLCELASWHSAERVVGAVVGMGRLRPAMAAIHAGKDVALANKETLVAGGYFVLKAVKEAGVKLLPVDSEHSAIFQCLQGQPPHDRSLKRLILTASGGPFFGKCKEDLKSVTVKDALQHPNWSMGAKVTIDSATMMNKGLELIEARWLFDMPEEKIHIVVHRESIVHSLVEYDDNAVLAQLGVPDMRLPIQYALTWPARLPCPVKQLQLEDWNHLTFYSPDNDTFPTMSFARRALHLGGAYPAALNAANEVAVNAFAEGKITFLDIFDIVGKTLEKSLPIPASVDEVYEIDTVIRQQTKESIRRMK